MFGGVVWVMVIPAVVTAGPLFVTVWVYVTLLPAATDVGDAEFVVTRSACVASATTSAAVALLFVRTGSAVVEVTLTVSLIAVPAAVPFSHLHDEGNGRGRSGRKTRVGADERRQGAGPPAGAGQRDCGGVRRQDVGQSHRGRRAWPIVRHDLRVRDVVLASTGTGLAVLVTERSAEPATWMLTVALLLPLFGSLLVEETESSG